MCVYILVSGLSHVVLSNI